MGPRHHGFIRTWRGQRYAEDSLSAALADPLLKPHCSWRGGLFPELEQTIPCPSSLHALFQNRHPTTGRRLKRTVSTSTRLDGDSHVSNICYGFSTTLDVHKSVSVAALVFGDTRLLDLTCDAYAAELSTQPAQADRRRPRPRQAKEKSTLSTGKAQTLIVPEVADRNGHPLLHLTATTPNVTAYREGDSTRHCALHFGRMARAVSALKKRANRRLFRALKRAGYLVHGRADKWTLGGVTQHLIEQWTVRRNEPFPYNHGAYPKVERIRRAQRRDNQYNRTKPAKKLLPLTAWQASWRAEMGEEQLRSSVAIYNATHARHRLLRARRQHRSSTVPAGSGTPTDSAEASSVLLPIRKQVLLDAVASVRPPPAAVPTCHDIVNTSLQLCEHALDHTTRAPARIRAVTIVADMSVYPWTPTASAILGLSFPGTQFRTSHRAGAFPFLKMPPSLAKTRLGRLLAQGAADLLGKFAQTTPLEIQKIDGMLDDGRRATQPPRPTAPPVVATAATRASESISPEPNIDLSP